MKSERGTQKRNAELARIRILTAARQEFVDKGYEGARVDDIALNSRFSKNLIYHYFGSKEALFVAVLDDLYESFLHRRKDIDFTAFGPEVGMRNFVHETILALREHSQIISLLNSENLHKARHVRKSTRVRVLYRSMMAQLRELLSRGAAKGVFRAGIDPINLYISISALMYHFLSNQYTLSAVLNARLDGPQALKARAEHVTEMILRFCKRDGAA
jgi:TetR/AcrR family transcriptional regulator